MSSIVISGDTSGAITLSAPAVAGTNTITLQAATGTVPLLNGSGNLTFPTSNAGIVFNNSSATTNSTLNDYEYGTFTVTDASGAGLTFTNNTGYYTKIGRLVTFTFDLNYPTTSSSAVARIGLPFTAVAAIASGGAVTYQSTGTTFGAYGSSNTSMSFYKLPSGVGQMSNADLSGKELAVVYSFQANF